MGSTRAPHIATALAAAAILVATLVPGHPAVDNPLQKAAWSPPVANYLLNVVLFAPFGAGLAALGMRWRRALLLGAVLSAAIELAQEAIPGRVPSVMDVLCNAAGAALGAGLFRGRAGWLRPSPGLARALVLGAGALAAGVFACTGFLMAPAPGAPPYFAHWTPHMASLEPYAGRVRGAWLDDLALPPTRLSNAEELRSRLMGDYVLRVEALAGPPPSGQAALLLLTSQRDEEILLLGPDGEDLVYRFRSRGRWLGLEAPRRRLPGALRSLPAGRPFDVRVERRQGALCIGLGESTPEACDQGFTVGDGWLLLAPYLAFVESRPALWRAAWIAAFFVPLGFWGRANAAGAAALALAASALLLAGTAPALLPTPASQLVAAVCGLAVGFAGRVGLERPGATLASSLRR